MGFVMLTEAVPEIFHVAVIILMILGAAAALAVGLHLIARVFAWIMDTMFKAGQS